MVIMIENNKTDCVKLLNITDIVMIDYNPSTKDLACQLIITTANGSKFVFVDYIGDDTLYDIVSRFYDDDGENIYIDVKNFRVDDVDDNKMVIHLDEGVVN